jgi:hypothetical protein
VKDWNRAAMMRNIWILIARGRSLWVAWVKEYLLKGKSFRQVKVPNICSWSWKKLLKLCELVRSFIQFEVGDSGTQVDYMTDMDIGLCMM